MRLLAEEAPEEYKYAGFRNSPAPPSAATGAAPPDCVPRSRCPWWPYSSSREYETNAAFILVVLVFALVCALSCTSAVRCVLRRRGRADKAAAAGEGDPGFEAPTVIFSAERGGEEECTICLAEFAEGERVRVLVKCKHCFHVPCIQKWLKNHSSCPTCRASYP